jgi:hypothetical protein
MAGAVDVGYLRRPLHTSSSIVAAAYHLATLRAILEAENVVIEKRPSISDTPPTAG